MKVYVVSFLIGFCMMSCKVRSSQLNRSVTEEELKACGEFNGSRMFFMLNAEEEFDADVTKSHNMFLKHMESSNRFTQYGYFTDENGQISGPCRHYVESQQAKYEQPVPTLSGPLATKENLINSIKRLGAAIKAKRKSAEFNLDSDKKEAFQIQVMLAFSSHGDVVNPKFHPDGVLVLRSPKKSKHSFDMPNRTSLDYDFIEFSELVMLIKEHLITECEDGPCTQPRDRKADEVVILMDTCYSGLFQRGLQNMLPVQLGYHRPLQSASKATRIMSFSASTPDQVATAGYAGSSRGTLFEIFSLNLNYWLADTDNNGIISYEELANYTVNGSRPVLLADLLESLTELGKSALNSGSDKGMFKEVYNDYIKNSHAYARFFHDPLQFLSSSSLMDGLLSLQRPEFYQNMSTDLFRKLLFAVREKNGTRQAVNLPGHATESVLANEFLIGKLVKLIQILLEDTKKNPSRTSVVVAKELNLGEDEWLYHWLKNAPSLAKPSGLSPTEMSNSISQYVQKKVMIEIKKEIRSENFWHIYIDGVHVSKKRGESPVDYSDESAFKESSCYISSNDYNGTEGVLITAPVSLKGSVLQHNETNMTMIMIDGLESDHIGGITCRFKDMMRKTIEAKDFGNDIDFNYEDGV
jgi:hypothetical protein